MSLLNCFNYFINRESILQNIDFGQNADLCNLIRAKATQNLQRFFSSLVIDRWYVHLSHRTCDCCCRIRLHFIENGARNPHIKLREN